MRKIFLYRVYTYLAHVPCTYRRVKRPRVLMINKDVHKPLARKNGNEILIWIWNNSVPLHVLPFHWGLLRLNIPDQGYIKYWCTSVKAYQTINFTVWLNLLCVTSREARPVTENILMKMKFFQSKILITL